MKITRGLGYIVVLLAQAAQAQTHYEQLEVGKIVQGAIGLGMFSKPYPLPAGQWMLRGRNVQNIPLVNSKTREPSGSVSKYVLTLRNTESESMLPLIVVSFTERRSTLDGGVKPCNLSTNKNDWVDNFSDRPASEYSSVGSFVCANSSGVSNFKKLVAEAGSHSNAWVKSILAPVAADANALPDNVVMVNIWASRYRAQTLETVYFVKQEGNLADPEYARHLKPWVHTTGQNLLAVVENKEGTVNVPGRFAGAESGTPVVIDNSVLSTFADAVPADAIRIPKQFDLVDVRPDNFRSVLLSCLPQLGKNVDSFELPPANVVSATYKAANSSRTFVLKNSVGVCLQSSVTKYPIFAADTFLDTVRPWGISDEVATDWNAQIARLMAIRGNIQVAYQYPNQGAMTAKFWMDYSNPLMIRYTTQFKAQGDWAPQSFDLVFRDPSLIYVIPMKVNAKGEGKKDLPF
ncbi:hypothetical protein [Rhodoferax sp.]|uniref:hypothetical protein n=1 Tax=Rhodoferax sp. TaxID=50421 RepID=UPI002ACDEF87|nr:hypothetical protein [Rhodoferax sp.]MDZ7921184.1 hypothetical protein [Rhodoferax sp.]